jgi:tetratricopeptide (TPR) repeat protein
MARKKRRFEQLEAAAAAPKEKPIYVNPIQQKVGERLEDVGKKFEGRGKTILYGVGALVVIAILVMLFMSWNKRTDAAAQTALGKAIETSRATISETGVPAGSAQKSFKTEKERAEAAIAEFQAIVDKFGGSVAETAKYFIAINRLDVDRAAGIQELEAIAANNTPSGKMAKFALAQTRVADNRLDEAAALYQELLAMDNPIVARETLNFELAGIYERQDKKQEAAELYFNIAKAASEAKDLDGNPVRLSQTAIEAKEKLEELDPERAKEIPEPTPSSPFGGFPIG